MAKLPPLPPEGTDFLDKATNRMHPLWRSFFKALAPILQTVADSIGGLEGDLAGLQLEDTWSHTQAKVADGTYFLCKTTFAGTINSTTTDATSGTCSARWKINGVNVGTTANSVSSTETTQTHSAANAFVAGDVITYTISSNSACLGALLQASVTRAAS